MWQYERHPPHLITVAILACESQNTENVVGYHPRKFYIRCIKASSDKSEPGSSRALHLLIWGVRQQSVSETQRFMTSMTWENAWCNLFWLWPERHQCWHDHLKSSVHADGGHFEHMLWHMNVHLVVDVKSWTCVHLHFRFSISQGSVATLIRWVGWSSYRHMYRSYQNLTVKTTLKSVAFWRNYRQK